MSPGEGTLVDHLQEEGEEDNHHTFQDHLQEAEEEEEAEEGHSRYLGKHLPNLLKNSWETHQLFLQEIEPR